MFQLPAFQPIGYACAAVSSKQERRRGKVRIVACLQPTMIDIDES